jgi:hypothetical protein
MLFTWYSNIFQEGFSALSENAYSQYDLLQSISKRLTRSGISLTLHLLTTIYLATWRPPNAPCFFDPNQNKNLVRKQNSMEEATYASHVFFTLFFAAREAVTNAIAQQMIQHHDGAEAYAASNERASIWRT